MVLRDWRNNPPKLWAFRGLSTLFNLQNYGYRTFDVYGRIPKVPGPTKAELDTEMAVLRKLQEAPAPGGFVGAFSAPGYPGVMLHSSLDPRGQLNVTEKVAMRMVRRGLVCMVTRKAHPDSNMPDTVYLIAPRDLAGWKGNGYHE